LLIDRLEDRQLLSVITVNTTADDTAADATLSLREAIEVSDGTLPVSSLSTQEQAQVSGDVASSNMIMFDIPTTDPGYDPTTGVWTIQVHSELPAITTNVADINGFTQPGSTLGTIQKDKFTIAISGAGQGTINGLTIDQPGTLVSGFDIENFGGAGVVMAGSGGSQLADCFIGTDPTGEKAAPNATGVEVESSSNSIHSNLISGNNAPGFGDGIYVPDQSHNPLNITPTKNAVQDNYIGVDAAGTKALGNGQVGVADFGSGDTYGGLVLGIANVISGNGAGGIQSGGSITIESNDIGTDWLGAIALGNGPSGNGITAGGPAGTAISVTIEDNVVSGNAQAGIALSPGSPGQSTFTVKNNTIGAAESEFTPLGNGGAGLLMTGVENATVLDNKIVANKDGIDLTGAGTDVQHNVFQGNQIGVDNKLDPGLGNTAYGISLSDAIGNTIGGTGSGQANQIVGNGGDAIHIAGGQQNRVTQNSIYGNAGAGIALISGANLSPPTLVLTFTGGDSGTLSGTLTGSPNTTYTVEIFANDTAPAAGHEQGQKFVQDVTLTTDASGQGNFSVSPLFGGYFYTATVTDPAGNTSGFSNSPGESVTVPASQTAVSSSANPSTVGAPVTFTAVVTAPDYHGTPEGAVTFTIDGQAQASVPLALFGSQFAAQFTTSTLAAGSHTVSAAYSGEADIVAASSGSLPTQMVGASSELPTTTTTVSSSANPSTAGQSVTFTAVVTASGYSGTPTGAVTFTIDGQAQTPVALAVVGGVDEAQFTTSTLAAGSHSVSAAYSGDANVAPSDGSLPTQTVDASSPMPTTTMVMSSADPSTAGQPVTFTAVVSPGSSPGMPTGTVTFTIDGTAQTPVPLQMVDGSDQATLTISTLTAGAHTIGATYNGDATFAASGLQQPLMQAVVAPTRPVTVPATVAPTVVSLKRYGIHKQPTVLTITFSAAMDPARVQNHNNYEIIRPCGRPVRIRHSVAYDPATKTVTLLPRRRINLHRTYWVEVMGAGAGRVADSHDVPLDGAGDGKAGSNYISPLDRRNVVLTPVEIRHRIPQWLFTRLAAASRASAPAPTSGPR
jgi:CSLREA domain-containing protein